MCFLHRSIPCKDLAFRAHYFLLSSHTLSKAVFGFIKAQVRSLGEEPAGNTMPYGTVTRTWETQGEPLLITVSGFYI